MVTPEIKCRILDMARDGATDREIAATLNVPGLRAIYIAQIVSKARREGAIIPYRSQAMEARREQRAAGLVPITINIDRRSLDYLKRVGDRRCVAPDYIAAALIETIAHDSIADAVLDDGIKSVP